MNNIHPIMAQALEPFAPKPLTIEEKLNILAALITEQQRARHEKEYTHPFSDFASAKLGKKYAKVDVGTSGKYMVEMDTQRIFGIKAYGVIHRGHQYGTLDTINDWDWSGYVAVPKKSDISTKKSDYFETSSAQES